VGLLSCVVRPRAAQPLPCAVTCSTFNRLVVRSLHPYRHAYHEKSKLAMCSAVVPSADVMREVSRALRASLSTPHTAPLCTINRGAEVETSRNLSHFARPSSSVTASENAQAYDSTLSSELVHSPPDSSRVTDLNALTPSPRTSGTNFSTNHQEAAKAEKVHCNNRSTA